MRNQTGLTEEQIQQCQLNWIFLTSGEVGIGETLNERDGNDGNEHFSREKLVDVTIQLDTSQAHISGSKTKFNEDMNGVVLGADAFPGSNAIDPNSRLSLLACLAHELSHAERYFLGFRRPWKGVDSHLDEAETSLHASFKPVLSFYDRIDLVEDARSRIDLWSKEIGEE